MLINVLAKGRPDNFQTPDWPLKTLLRHLNSHAFSFDGSIWDPCCGKGNIVNNLKVWGYEAVGTDLPNDFLTCEVPFGVGSIITNPPYSIKDKFLTRCYEIGKPFALLMPLSALEGKTRQALYRKHGMQLVLLPRRVNYETPSGKGSGAHFASAWFTNGFNLPKDMEFVE